MRAARCALPLVTALAVASCTSTTEPRPLEVDTRVVSFTSEAERLAWPTTPTISGGAVLQVRGWASVGCGDLAASAGRSGMRVNVSVSAVNSDRICAAVYPATVPFEATVRVAPGSYWVRASVVGSEPREAIVAVEPTGGTGSAP